jgi:ornithine carbamoyltransferase
MSLTIACPEGYEPDSEVVERCCALGGACRMLHDPMEAVRNADYIYTDVWASMGQEEELEKRKRDFARYQVNEKLLAHAPRHALVTHCLPAHRGEEITDAVIDGPQCAAFDEAENRLHVQKAVLLFLMNSQPLS